MQRLALLPSHPERVCWGCDQHCPAGDLDCGNGTERTPHPVEIFGRDWVEWASEQGQRPIEEPGGAPESERFAEPAYGRVP